MMVRKVYENGTKIPHARAWDEGVRRSDRNVLFSDPVKLTQSIALTGKNGRMKIQETYRKYAVFFFTRARKEIPVCRCGKGGVKVG